MTSSAPFVFFFFSAGKISHTCYVPLGTPSIRVTIAITATVFYCLKFFFPKKLQSLFKFTFCKHWHRICVQLTRFLYFDSILLKLHWLGVHYCDHSHHNMTNFVQKKTSNNKSFPVPWYSGIIFVDAVLIRCTLMLFNMFPTARSTRNDWPYKEFSNYNVVKISISLFR